MSEIVEYLINGIESIISSDKKTLKMGNKILITSKE